MYDRIAELLDDIRPQIINKRRNEMDSRIAELLDDIGPQIINMRRNIKEEQYKLEALATAYEIYLCLAARIDDASTIPLKEIPELLMEPIAFRLEMNDYDCEYEREEYIKKAKVIVCAIYDRFKDTNTDTISLDELHEVLMDVLPKQLELIHDEILREILPIQLEFIHDEDLEYDDVGEEG